MKRILSLCLLVTCLLGPAVSAQKITQMGSKKGGPPPPDTEPPSVTVVSPASGANVTGSIPIVATARDNKGVKGVQFKLDGSNLGAEDTTFPYALLWDSTAASDGPHSLTAVARDQAGNSTTSAAISVTVNNAAPVGDTVLLADDFDDDMPDASKWSTGALQSVGTNPAVTVAESGQRFNWTSLVTNGTGANYNGLTSVNTYNLTGGYAYVSVPVPPSASTATVALQLMLLNASNPATDHYRFSLEANGSYRLQKRIGGSTSLLASGTYDPTGMRFIRVRHDSAHSPAQVVYEVAPAVGGAPGGWTELYAEAWQNWNGSGGVDPAGIRFEIRGGTFGPEASPGALAIDNFKAAVMNAAADSSAPAVAVTNPANGATVSGTVNVKASASDNCAIKHLAFQVDNVTVGSTLVAAPFSYSWNTVGLDEDSTHTLRAVATDLNDNSTTSTSLTVTVHNGSGGGGGGEPAEAELPRVSLASLDSLSTSGYTTVSASTTSQYQSELYAAAARADSGGGSTLIILTANVNYYGGFIAPRRNDNGTWIVTRSSAIASLPAGGQRVAQTDSEMDSRTQFMPRLLANQNGVPALTSQTSTLTQSSNRYRFEGVFFGEETNVLLQYSLIALGTSGAEQNTLAEVPHYFVLDRCASKPNQTSETFRGVGANVGHFAMVGCYFYHYGLYGNDGQAMAAWNTPGPLRFKNNHFDGTGESTILGGADPDIPDCVPTDVEFIGNHYWRDRRTWEEGILGLPPQPSASVLAGGSLAGSTTYLYRVVQHGKYGYGSDGSGYTLDSKASVARSATTTSTNKSVQLTWARSAHVGHWNPTYFSIYRSSDSGATWSYQDYTPADVTATSYSFTDTGAAGTAVSGQPWQFTRGHYLVQKNIFEIKFVLRALIEDNIFEYHYAGLGQDGPAFLLTPRNQNDFAPWISIKDVTIRWNLFRHIPAAITISGVDNDFNNNGGFNYSGPTERVLIENNLFDDVDSFKYGGGQSVILQSTQGLTGTVLYPSDVIFRNNTAGFNYDKCIYLGELSGGQYPNFARHKYTDNILSSGQYGVFGGNKGTGNPAFQTYVPDMTDASQHFHRNVIIGGSASDYSMFVQSQNYFPATASAVGFTLYNSGDGGNYSLLSSSPYHNFGTNGKDIGCDVVTLYSRLGLTLP